jgi:hypothetical protein
MANFAYKDGSQADVANGVYVHHIIIADYSGKMQLMPPVSGYRCPKGGSISPMPPMMSGPGGSHSRRAFESELMKRQFAMSVFVGGGGSVGSGNPFSTRPGSKVKSGYWIGKAGNMYLTSEIVNYDKKDKDIYLTLDIEWSPGRAPDMLDVGMGAISADNCASKEKGLLHPPKNKAIVYNGEDWSVGSPGWMINFSPHIHDGGVNIKAYVNGKEVCESKAVYGIAGGTVLAPDGKPWQTITGYTPCENPTQIKRGDKIRISSEYDLTKYRL